MPQATIEWEGGVDGRIRLIDQTLLPTELKYVNCDDTKSIWHAIKTLMVRGAPAIGIAGAMGVVLGAKAIQTNEVDVFLRELNKVVGYLGSSRPTAVNLFWGISRMELTAHENKGKTVKQIKELLLQEALKIQNEDKIICRQIGENGAGFITNGIGALTHCNAGGLATADYGTALAVFFKAKEQGKHFKVYADETRPLLQGSRLTAWELMQAGIDVTLICDNMAAHVMKLGKIQCVVVGADRIAANGDAANKIGTYGVSILAKEHGIPFYVAAPVSTFDLSIKSGNEIPIEERSPEEVTNGFGKRTAPEGVKVFNPAFDVTPAQNITAIITEKGVIHKPSIESVQGVLGRRA
ncbi:MAG: S-methyl-5-thioribose-1-phosphate isomerase [Planctomycetota bacterium]